MDATNIEKLITMPKKVLKVPPKDFKQDNQHLRKDFTLQSTEGDLQFSAFIRRHIDFQENFSIGLDFHPAGEKEIPLIRCNGNHGEVVENLLKPNPHLDYHIHILKTEDIEQEIRKLSLEGITKEYDSLEKALQYFIKRVNIQNVNDYFDLNPMLFNNL